MSKKPFGGLFDFNHDGQESLFEQFTAYHLSDGAMPTDHLPKWIADAFRASIPKPYTPSYHDYSTDYSDPDWWDTCEDGSEYDLYPQDFDSEDEYNDALEEARNAWKDDCEDGSKYGLDPDDYDSEDEYNDALEEARNAWKDTCEDGSEYGLDPDDYDSEDEYNDALEEARNAWKDTCEDGSEYGLDPDDFDDEDEYNDALEAARNAWKDTCEDSSEYEDESAATTISISFSIEFPGLEKLKAIHEEDYPNKRRYKAAYALANEYVGYAREEDRIKDNDRCRFILEQGDRLVAANYLSYDYGFLYAQAVKDHFDLPCSLPSEDESRKIEFHEMLCRIAKRHIGLSLEVWKWCLDEFMPYAQYDDEAEGNMTSDALSYLYRFPKTFRTRLLDKMEDDPDFLQTLVTGGSEFSDTLAELISLAIQTKRYDTAVSILRAALPKGEKDPAQLRHLISETIGWCKTGDELETMEFFRDHCLSLVAPSAAVAEDLEKWNAEIAEYIDEMENECYKYAYSRKFAWRKTVPGTKEYCLDPGDFETEQEYMDELYRCKYGWREYVQDTLGLDPNDYETEDEFNAAYDAKEDELRNK